MMSAGQAYERGLITPDEFAECIMSAVERECRRDFEKQSGEPMLEKDYGFTLINIIAESAIDILIVFEVRDKSIFSYRNYAVAYANISDHQHWALRSVVQYIESDLYVVSLENGDIPLLPDSPKPSAWAAIA